MNCDTIIYMEEGKIIDQGTYPELLQRNKKFRDMAQAIDDLPEQETESSDKGIPASF